MKKLGVLIMCAMAAASCTTDNKLNEITENLRFCESVVPYDGGLIISNFGGEELNPLNRDGKGYIAFYKDKKVSVLIPPSGILNAPKGLAIKDNRLFIADVNRVVVYNLDLLETLPQIIEFPSEDVFVNAFALDKDIMYVSVTNTGRVYTLDVSDLENLSVVSPVFFADVVGANGMVADDNNLYVASYPADDVVTDDNTIYVLTKEADGIIKRKVVERPGQYDGLVISKDKKYLYFTSWLGGEVGKIDIETGLVDVFVNDVVPVGPADMAFYDEETLAVPDLPNSRVFMVSLK